MEFILLLFEIMIGSCYDPVVQLVVKRSVSGREDEGWRLCVQVLLLYSILEVAPVVKCEHLINSAEIMNKVVETALVHCLIHLE